MTHVLVLVPDNVPFLAIVYNDAKEENHTKTSSKRPTLHKCSKCQTNFRDSELTVCKVCTRLFCGHCIVQCRMCRRATFCGAHDLLSDDDICAHCETTEKLGACTQAKCGKRIRAFESSTCVQCRVLYCKECMGQCFKCKCFMCLACLDCYDERCFPCYKQLLRLNGQSV